MNDLKGKQFFITGATGGIGMVVVEECLKRGAKVFATGRNESVLEAEILAHPEFNFMPADLTNPNDLSSLIKLLPPLDGVLYGAGIIDPFPIKFIHQKHIDTIFSINFDSICLLTSLLAQNKLLKDKSSLVFLSSVSAEFPYKGGALYAASKAAVEAYAKGIALEFSPKGIRANSIRAALVETAMFEKTKNALTTEEIAEVVSAYPLGIGTPLDIANAVLFLWSDLSSWMTGSVLNLDGGLLLNSKK